MGKGKKNVRKEVILKDEPSKEVPIDPFGKAEKRCEDFTRGMLASFYLHSLNEMLNQAEDEGIMDSLEIRISLQIVIDSLLDESALPH